MEQTDFLSYAVQALDRLHIAYALVGSFASGVWGESRFTQDIDLLIELKPSQVSLLCDAFPDSDFYVSRSAATEAAARQSQFNVIHPASGNKIDFMIAGGNPWSSAELQRGKRVQILPNLQATVAAPEDVILGKLVYYGEGGSDKHLRDITGILQLSDELVDRTYVSEWAAKLGVAEVWQSVLERLEQQ